MKLKDLKRGDLFKIKMGDPYIDKCIYVMLDQQVNTAYTAIRELIPDNITADRHYFYDKDEIPKSFSAKAQEYMYKYKGWNYMLYELDFISTEDKVILLNNQQRNIESIAKILLK